LNCDLLGGVQQLGGTNDGKGEREGREDTGPGRVTQEPVKLEGRALETVRRESDYGLTVHLVFGVAFIVLVVAHVVQRRRISSNRARRPV
jgi:hypothetical protein